MLETVAIRPIEADDWAGIAALEHSVYAPKDLSEGREVLESRASASPRTCFVLASGARIAGYVLAMPYPEGRYPDLTQPEDTGFRSPNLHLHDLVIDPQLRGTGMAKRLLAHLTTTAESRGHDRISLVAVADSATFWSANGFRFRPEVALPASYGPSAMYMSKAIQEGP